MKGRKIRLSVLAFGKRMEDKCAWISEKNGRLSVLGLGKGEQEDLGCLD